MEGLRLILNDGSVIEGGEAGYTGVSLWLRFPGYTMQDVSAIVFDPGKTRHITFQYGDMRDDFSGFTDCVIIKADEGRVSACMAGGVKDVYDRSEQ